MHPFGEVKSRAQSLEMKEDSWCESNRKKPNKGSASLDPVSMEYVTVVGCARDLDQGQMSDGRSLSVVCGDEDAQSD